MAIQNYRITLRADVSADGVEAMDEVVRQVAAQLSTMVVLLNQGRYKPEILITRTNAVFDEVSIHLLHESGNWE